MVSFQANQMLDCIIFGVIQKKENTRSVIEPDVILRPPEDVTKTKCNRWFDREIIIRNPVESTDVDVVVVNATNPEQQTILETPRLWRIAFRPSGLCFGDVGFVHWIYFDRRRGWIRRTNWRIQRRLVDRWDRVLSIRNRNTTEEKSNRRDTARYQAADVANNKPAHLRQHSGRLRLQFGLIDNTEPRP